MSLHSLLAYLLTKAMKVPAIRSWLLGLTHVFKAIQPLAQHSISVDIPEITPIETRKQDDLHRSRLNLLVPALSQQHLFGGIQTALQIFDAMRPHFEIARIIVTDEASPELVDNAFYSGWPKLSMEASDTQIDHIVALGNRWGRTLSVGPQDYFVATAWWTAHTASTLLDNQSGYFPGIGKRHLAYLIQDYEPGFYPWSTRYALAQATYALRWPTIAIINSQWLNDYLRQLDHSFAKTHVLQPKMHPKLSIFRQRTEAFKKKKQILIYGRPGTERNAFTLIVAALRKWAAQSPTAQQWTIISAGESFDPIDLGNGCQLISMGKLGIEVYARTLSDTSVGVSLMISPHPSYPPLEMAAFGVHTITNRFGYKNLSDVSSFLEALVNLDIQSLTDAIFRATSRFESHGVLEQVIHKDQIDWVGSYLDPAQDPSPCISDAASELLTSYS